jgi:hypothetical protein
MFRQHKQVIRMDPQILVVLVAIGTSSNTHHNIGISQEHDKVQLVLKHLVQMRSPTDHTSPQAIQHMHQYRPTPVNFRTKIRPTQNTVLATARRIDIRITDIGTKHIQVIQCSQQKCNTDTATQHNTGIRRPATKRNRLVEFFIMAAEAEDNSSFMADHVVLSIMAGFLFQAVIVAALSMERLCA